MDGSVVNLEEIIKPVALQIAAAADITEGGIVLVIHKPGPLARRALKSIGIKVPTATTGVIGVNRGHAEPLCTDPVTARWIRSPPLQDEIKIFLYAGDGTALISLGFSEEGVIRVTKVPDLYPV